MNDDDLEQQLRKALYAIAPDIEGEPLDADVRYRDQFEFDSMDFLRFIMELHRLTGVDIPESDYPRLLTLGGGIAYLREKANRQG